jgi:enediyne biosynthesis protein E4
MALLITLLDSGVSLAQIGLQFAEAAKTSGLLFEHTDGGDKEPYLPALMTAGLALLDYDGDGWEDVYFLNGHSLHASKEKPKGNSLFRNRGDGTFMEVTDRAGARSFDFCLGVVAADIDNDGDQDILLSNYGPSKILRNNGDGTFSEEWLEVKVDNEFLDFGAGIACLDLENDGLLDVFVAKYVDFSMDRYRAVAPKSYPYPPGPKDFPPSTNRLYRNRGDGTFEDISSASGMDRYPGPSMGVVCGDWDEDNDADIFVCSDAAPNQLFINDGSGRFDESALLHGVAYDIAGNANGSMGVDAGDYDGDGHLDLLVTNYTDQIPVLYKNQGRGLFEDVSNASRVGRDVLLHTNWGVGFADFDNDRDLDVFFANGHLLKNIESIDSRTSYKVANTLMLNDGLGRFSNVSKSSGEGLRVIESSRGSVFGDLDHDGDLDAVVLNANAHASYLLNQSRPMGNWISVRLVGVVSNRDAIGAMVIVSSDAGRQVQVVHAGRGYQSHYGTELHFGLGDSTQVNSVDVIWPGGRKESMDGVVVGQRIVLIENLAPRS